jgi:hypothetical protein
MGLLADPLARRSVVPSTRMGNTRFSIRGRGVPLLLTQRRTTMSSNPSRHVACRLLGGSGRQQLVAAPVRKLPALCAPLSRIPVDAVTACRGRFISPNFSGANHV